MIILCAHCNKPNRKFPRDLLRGKKLYCNRVCQTEGSKKKVKKICIICKTEFHVHPSDFKRYKTCSKKCLVKSRTGKGNSNWKGGFYLANHGRPEIFSRRYKNWRLSVFRRDNYTCLCGQRGGWLEAHHIKPWAKFPKLRD